MFVFHFFGFCNNQLLLTLLGNHCERALVRALRQIQMKKNTNMISQPLDMKIDKIFVYRFMKQIVQVTYFLPHKIIIVFVWQELTN